VTCSSLAIVAMGFQNFFNGISRLVLRAVICVSKNISRQILQKKLDVDYDKQCCPARLETA